MYELLFGGAFVIMGVIALIQRRFQLGTKGFHSFVIIVGLWGFPGSDSRLSINVS
jgi:hypothetical protein